MKPSVSRRILLQTGLAGIGLSAAGKTPVQSGTKMVDVNVHLGRWPFRRLAQDDTAGLAVHLKANGVTEAWVASFDGLLHEDLAAVNSRTAQECAKSGAGVLRPVGSVNPTLPGWRLDIERCASGHGMKVIRLAPGYHGYTLADAVFAETLKLAADARLLVQIVAQMEDQRTQNVLMPVKPVDFKPLRDAMASAPKSRVMVLNANTAMVLSSLRGCSNVWLDTAMIEGVGGLEQLLKSWPEDKICLGSHAPLFYWEAARLKLQESGIEGGQRDAVTHQNALQALS